jgi:D-alanine transaminase
MTDIAYFNGTFLPRADVRISPDDRGFLFADGIYEVLRAYGGRLFALEPHLQRLADGLSALGIVAVDAGAVGEIAQELLRRNGRTADDALVYVQITRGAAPRTHAFPDPPPPPTVYASVTPFTPKADPARGVSVITVPDLRWTRCDIKSVALLPNCLAAQRAREAGAMEAVFVRDGVAIEGTATSFFGVIDGEVRTAPRSNYILPSVTRAMTLALCAEHGIPHSETPIRHEDLAAADELFLASTTVEVMPIVRVDGRPVSGGVPGPIAARLLHLFRERTLAPVAL